MLIFNFLFAYIYIYIYIYIYHLIMCDGAGLETEGGNLLKLDFLFNIASLFFLSHTVIFVDSASMA